MTDLLRNLSATANVLAASAIGVFVLSGFVFQPGLLQAQTIVVTKFEDTNDHVCDEDCSLREAISLANSTAEADYINLQSGTYVIEIPVTFDSEYDVYDSEWEEELRDHEDENENGDFDILNPLTIVGSTEGTTSIDGGSLDRIFDVLSGTATLKNLTLTNGRIRDYGGALRNKAEATLKNCTVQDNQASAAYTGGVGGGIANYGTLSLYGCSIDNNLEIAGEATSGMGGGIYNEGSLVIRESSVTGNRASDDSDSGKGGGLFNVGRADIRRSYFSGNEGDQLGEGSAIFNAGILQIYSSTISENYAAEGSAVANGSLRLYIDGWATFEGRLDIFDSTIINNVGGGLKSTTQARVKNSIIAGNVADDDDDRSLATPVNCRLEGTANQRLYNVILGNESDTSCFNAADAVYLIAYEDIFTTLLSPLTETSGPTPFYSLRENSIAVDTGRAPCPSKDQARNIAPLDGDGDGISECDIGAVEYQEK